VKLLNTPSGAGDRAGNQTRQYYAGPAKPEVMVQAMPAGPEAVPSMRRSRAYWLQKDKYLWQREKEAAARSDTVGV
jgi:hypothetical protein